MTLFWFTLLFSLLWWIHGAHDAAVSEQNKIAHRWMSFAWTQQLSAGQKDSLFKDKHDMSVLLGQWHVDDVLIFAPLVIIASAAGARSWTSWADLALLAGSLRWIFHDLAGSCYRGLPLNSYGTDDGSWDLADRALIKARSLAGDWVQYPLKASISVSLMVLFSLFS